MIELNDISFIENGRTVLSFELLLRVLNRQESEIKELREEAECPECKSALWWEGHHENCPLNPKNEYPICKDK